MKKLLLAFFISLSIISSSKAQGIYIPDSLFRNALLTNIDINTNGDTSITLVEAAGFTDTMDLWHLHINTLQGIEYFTNMTGLNCEGECCGLIGLLRDLDLTQCTNLKWLNCFNNQIHDLDLSQNTDLEVLNCGSNPLGTLDLNSNILLKGLYCDADSLTSINISQNANLEQFYCVNNSLTSIDITGNTALKALYCSNNPLSSFDLSKNIALEELLCVDDQLTSLDVSKNLLLSYFYCFSNPALTTICVNSIADATAQELAMGYLKDSSAQWSEGCKIVIIDPPIDALLSPNPSNGQFNFNGLETNSNIEVYDLTGRLIFSTVSISSTTKIDLSQKGKGIYTFKVIDSNHTLQKGKIIVQ